MPIYMETTQIEDTKTVAEIQDLLARRGASCVQVDYHQGKVEGLAFQLLVGESFIPFRLPCRWKKLEALLKRSGKRPRKKDSFELWARRVAWRQILRWVEAQLAIIETGMVQMHEVFLPYALTNAGGHECTMFEMIEQQKFLALSNKASEADVVE